MSTKRTTQGFFDPQSMDLFHQFGASGSNVLQDYMKDPMKASYVNLMLQQMNRQAGLLGQRGMQNLFTNVRSAGFGGSNMPAYLQSGLARQGRFTSGLQAQGLLGTLLGAEQNRRWATGQALGYRPLQTGQEERTSGLGTWLPQAVSAGLGLASGFMGGGGGRGLAAGFAGSNLSGSAAGSAAGASAAANVAGDWWNPTMWGR